MSIREEMETSRTQGMNERRKKAEKYSRQKMIKVRKKLVENSRYGKEQCSLTIKQPYVKYVNRLLEEESLMMIQSDVQGLISTLLGYKRWIVFKIPVVGQRIDGSDDI